MRVPAARSAQSVGHTVPPGSTVYTGTFIWYELSDSASPYHITLYQSISGITAMHLTEVAPVTQIRPLRPVAAAVQTSSAVKTAELQTQFVD